jgi:hypothetical protein
MAESYVNEQDIKRIKAKMQEVVELGTKQDMSVNPLKYTVSNPLDIVLAVSIDRLEKSSQILNRLTVILIVFTIFLAILTGISVWKLF